MPKGGNEMEKEILIALGRLEGKVDALMTRQAIHDEKLEGHDKRLRELEQSKAWILGAAAVLGALGAFIMNLIGGNYGG